jgi:enamine deaminase RidA (YjgF/YER057c/UK114 family)
MRKLISSGSPYEPKVGISRAVRVGNIIAVSGTAPIGLDGRTVGIGDATVQARRCLEIIAAALEKAGASLRQVVRTRTLLVRIEPGRQSPQSMANSLARFGPLTRLCRYHGLLTPIGSSSSKLMPLSRMNRTPNPALQGNCSAFRSSTRFARAKINAASI